MNSILVHKTREKSGVLLGLGSMPTSKITSVRPATLIRLCLVAITCIVYWQVTEFDFINTYDDLEYIIENSNVREGLTLRGVGWAFGTFHSGHWHPITWLSHMLDVQLYGMNAGRHHLMNVLFHIAGTLLLFSIFHSTTGYTWRSGFIAAMFALHPLHVESVAMIAERKDVMSAFFWMVTLRCYIAYAVHPRKSRYLFVAGCFVLGLLTKPMVMTLPFVFLLLDYWPLNRFSPRTEGDGYLTSSHSAVPRLIAEKVPFLLFSAASSIVTWHAAKSQGALEAMRVYPFIHRLANALVSYTGYLGKMIWPKSLTVFYPYRDTLLAWQVMGAILLVAGLTTLFLTLYKRHPYLIVGWLWYLVTLLPVIGLVQAGAQSMADRYTYIPLIGIFIIIAWALPEILNPWRLGKIVLAMSICLCLSLLTALTWMQIGYWKNSTALFQHAVNVTQQNWVAHNNLGTAFLKAGKKEEALRQYQKVLEIIPNHANAHFNLGVTLAELGRRNEAIDRYRKALALNASHVKALNNLGGELIARGEIEQGVKYCRKALEIDPEFFNAHSNIALAMTALGKKDEAILHFQKALQMNPDNAKAHQAVGNLLAEKGRFAEAQYHYVEAIRSDPENEAAYKIMGDFSMRNGNFAEAAQYYSAALRLAMGNADTYNKLGVALIRQGNFKDAIINFQEALRLDPDHPHARSNLQKALKHR